MAKDLDEEEPDLEMLGMSEADKISTMNRLIEMWREPALSLVCPALVVPDTTNRENTGLSPVHVHYIACRMEADGFQTRGLSGGHELPIVVRENTSSRLGAESVAKWHVAVKDAQGAFPPPPAGPLLGTVAPLPPVPAGNESLPCLIQGIHKDRMCDVPSGHSHFFTSLGNGHFFQALNLFGHSHPCLFADEAGGVATSDGAYSQRRYDVGSDRALRFAVDSGVQCVILRAGISERARKFISRMLNSAFEYEWRVDGSGRVYLDRAVKKTKAVSLFEGMTKNADSFELGALVTQHMKLQAERKRAQAGQKKDAQFEQERRKLDLQQRRVRVQQRRSRL